MRKSRKRQSVLIIDDNPAIRIQLRGYLKTHGFKVIEAHDGSRGLSLASKHTPEFILVQGVLPDARGMTVIRKLRQRKATHSIPVIFYTGSHKEKMRYRLNTPKETHYLHCPWDGPRMMEIIREDIWLENVLEDTEQNGDKQLKRKAQ